MRIKRILQAIGKALLLTIVFAGPVLAAPVAKPLAAPAKAVQTAAPMVTAAADVIVKKISFVPEKPMAGEAFEVHVELFNQGEGLTSPGQQCVLGIEPGGGPAGPFPVPTAIAPGQSYDFVKKFVFMQAGNYVALARPIPGQINATVQPFVLGPSAQGMQPAPVMQKTLSGAAVAPGADRREEVPEDEGVQSKLKTPPILLKGFDPQPEPPGKILVPSPQER